MPTKKTKSKSKSKSKGRKQSRSSKKVIIPLDQDEHYLSESGYTVSKSEADRRAALRKVVNKKVRNDKMARPDAIRKTLQRINVLRIYRKNEYPKQAKRIGEDVDYLSRMLKRENAKIARAKPKSKSKSKGKRKAKKSKSKSKTKSKSKIKTKKAKAKGRTRK